jgi:putative ABC transport system ATP-binding protein
MSEPLIRGRDVARTYALDGVDVPALRGVSFDIGSGEYVAITGPSGCGKSSLLNLLGALDAPTAGRVTVAGTDLAALDDRAATRFRLRSIGFVFQRFYLMPQLSAFENVELPMAEAGLPRAERTERAMALLGRVGLSGRERHRPAQLSGGEQQRVAIARALANRPRLLLADEPTGELDARTGAEVIELFAGLHAEGTTLVVVTHDDALAHAAPRRIVLRDGVVVEDRRVPALPGAAVADTGP